MFLFGDFVGPSGSEDVSVFSSRGSGSWSASHSDLRNKSTRIEDAGIAIRHSRGYFSILQAPGMVSGGVAQEDHAQNQGKAFHSE